MLSRLPFFILLTAPLALHAASQEQEYQQVRTIALRDPKVRAAYEDADRRLDEKILKIDPALESYLKHRTRGEAPKATVEHPGFNKPSSRSQPAPMKPAAPAKTAAAPKATAHFERSHVVLKGETLTSIAAIFGVTVEAVKTANHIVDERKLQVGQKLEIPDRTR